MQNELVRKKKIGGKDGKAKWRKQSDTSNLQLYQLSQAKKEFAENARPKSTGAMFKIQVEPDAAIKKKLDKDRFKEKINLTESKAEKSIRKRLDKKMVAQGEGDSTEVDSNGARSKTVPQKKAPAAIVDPDLEAEFDVWGIEPKELDILFNKPQIRTKKEIDMPKIIKPLPGQSYNPSQKDHIDLMKVVIDRAEIKRPNFKTKSEKAIEKTRKQMLEKRPPQKPRTKKEKELMDEHEKQREEKKKEFEIKNFDRLVREADNKSRKQGKKILN